MLKFPSGQMLRSYVCIRKTEPDSLNVTPLKASRSWSPQSSSNSNGNNNRYSYSSNSDNNDDKPYANSIVHCKTGLTPAGGFHVWDLSGSCLNLSFQGRGTSPS